MKQRHFIIPFLCLMLLMTASLVQGFTHWIPAKPLSGFYDAKSRVKLSMDTWMDGSFQDYLTDYARVHTGFREFLIRSYNQLCYWCFDKISNDNVVCGKNKELYMTMYLDDISGKRVKEFFETEERAKAVARDNVKETLRLIDTLHQHHTDFLFVFAPSKVYTDQENLPNAYQNCLKQPHFILSEYYIELFKEAGIPYLDLFHCFRDIKDTVSYPLYTRYGSHWSEASIPFVADTLFRALETVTGYSLPSIEVIDENITTDYSNQDGELEALMNLYFPVEKPPVGRPVFRLTDTVGKDHPNLLVVGDSYFIQVKRSCFNDAFHYCDYWRYNENLLTLRENLNWKKVDYYAEAYQMLEDADIVMAIVTSPYIYEYLWGFEQRAFNLFAHGPLNEEETILLKMEEIKSNPEWYEAIVKQAAERNLSVEDNLRDNAIYVLNSHKQ